MSNFLCVKSLDDTWPVESAVCSADIIHPVRNEGGPD